MRRTKVEWRQRKNKGVNFSFSLRDDAVATAELNEFVLSRVCEQIAPHRTSPNLVSEMFS